MDHNDKVQSAGACCKDKLHTFVAGGIFVNQDTRTPEGNFEARTLGDTHPLRDSFKQ
jgi:hypothetical protein